VAARLKTDLQLDAEVTPGDRGEFSVWVNGRKVAEKAHGTFPSDDAIVQAVKNARSG
jgi:predicted Rdx family selenoprotein